MQVETRKEKSLVDLWLQYWQKSPVSTMDRKRFPRPEPVKARRVRSKVIMMLIVFLKSKLLSTMKIFQNFCESLVSESLESTKIKLSDTTIDKRILVHPSRLYKHLISWFFCWNKDKLASPATVLSRPCSLWHFPVPKTEIHFERMKICHNQLCARTTTKRFMHDPKSGLEKLLHD